MHKFNVLLLLSVLFFLSCKQNKTPKAEDTDEKEIAVKELTAKLDSIYTNGLINGFAVSMVNEDGILYSKGFGFADVKNKKRYTENTIQNIASVSKTLIGIALLRAKELGKLQLDDPIQKYLPFKVFNPYHPKEVITIRHLATHTSGINDTDQYMNKAWIIVKDQDLTNISTDYPEQRLNSPDHDIPMEEYLKGYLEEKGPHYQKDNYLTFKPGKRYNYSNIGATLAALVIEKATGIAFDAFTKTYILDPLEMNDSGWFLEDVDVSKHSEQYRNDNTLLPRYKAITYPDGMLISSSTDMGKYLSELIKGYSGKGTLLEPESYKELFSEQLDETHFEEGDRNPNHPYDEDYDPALFIGHSALGYIGHSGGDAGVATWMFFDKEKKVGRYIVINCDMGNDDRARELEYYAIYDTSKAYVDTLNE